MMKSEDEFRHLHVAILYQDHIPPIRNGITKPMKPGGYADSGADIAFALKVQGIPVVTPVNNPDGKKDLEWVFPDTEKGIKEACKKGANVLWLNTVLFEGHPVESAIRAGISIVGQPPHLVEKYDDKSVTNDLLRAHCLPIPESIFVTGQTINSIQLPFDFPAVIKPVKGRGSQGVVLVNNESEFTNAISKTFAEGLYGKVLYVEPYLPGDEITITVMPPGNYSIKGIDYLFERYWSLPPVKRINHQNGIAPYNGTVAVINNSVVLDDNEIRDGRTELVCKQCEFAASLVLAKAPIRIDCRADSSGKFFLFDLNMKPNMTGSSRSHRLDQDSLSTLAARKIGWSFTDLLVNILKQRWTTTF